MTPEQYAVIRKTMGTQEQVAEMLNIARETIARRETGKDRITREAGLALIALSASPQNQKAHDAQGSQQLGSATRPMNEENREDVTALPGLATSACPLPEIVQTAFVFAARYVHHRDTGGTLAVCKALAYVWPDLSEQTRSQILRESYEATTNIREWERFRGVEEENDEPSHS